MSEEPAGAARRPVEDESTAPLISASDAQPPEAEALRGAAAAWAEVMAERQRSVDVEGQLISAQAPATTPGGPPETVGTAAHPSTRRPPAPVTMRRVLIPLDGSPYAERALPYAAALVSTTGAGATLAHVQVPSGPRTVAYARSVIQSLITETPITEPVEFPTYLRSLRTWMLQYVPDVDIEQIDAPTALAGLTTLHQRRQTDVTVIASHTRQGAGRLIVGSVADGLVREGSALVLVVPPLVDVPMASMPLLTRVLVPLDGSERAERALGPVLGWLEGEVPSELAPRHVMLLTVAATPWALQHAEQYVQAIREVLTPALPGVEITVHVRLGAAAEEIVTAADVGLVSPTGATVRPDLIIMGTHGRSGLGRWLYGSVAGHVLPRVHMPVLLTHP